MNRVKFIRGSRISAVRDPVLLTFSNAARCPRSRRSISPEWPPGRFDSLRYVLPIPINPLRSIERQALARSISPDPTQAIPRSTSPLKGTCRSRWKRVYADSANNIERVPLQTPRHCMQIVYTFLDRPPARFSAVWSSVEAGMSQFVWTTRETRFIVTFLVLILELPVFDESSWK